MVRKLVALLALIALTACTPELIPRPVTPAPSLPAATDTPAVAAISAPPVTSPALTSIHMLDKLNGWGVSETSVLRTNDGGHTWYDVGPKNAGLLGYASTSFFLDQQHAWVLAADQQDILKGTMHITTNGGQTWNSGPVAFGGGDIHFLDAKNGWVMATLGAAAGSMGVSVLRTVDGGLTWQQAYTNDPNIQGAGDSLPLGGMKDGITPINMQTAWIGGVVYMPGTVYLYRTDDGGTTWKQVSLQIPDGYSQAELDIRPPVFVSARQAYMTMNVASQNGVMLAVYVSHDGGNSWVLTPTMIPQGGASDFVGAQDGFVWSGTSLYVTHDAAQTWTSITPDVNFTDGFSGMDFVDAQNGWIVTSDASGAHALYMTTDGGSTWNVLAR